MKINTVITGTVLAVKKSLKGKEYAQVYDGTNLLNVFGTTFTPDMVGQLMDLQVNFIVDGAYISLVQ